MGLELPESRSMLGSGFEDHAERDPSLGCEEKSLYLSEAEREAEKKRVTKHAEKYGLKFDQDWYLLYAFQHGLCFICVQPETFVHPNSKTGKPISLALDHDHGHCLVGCRECIRFYLCRDCNLRIGRVERYEEAPTQADSLYLRFCQAIRDGRMDHPVSVYNREKLHDILFADDDWIANVISLTNDAILSRLSPEEIAELEAKTACN